jgi:hypothetical protein
MNKETAVSEEQLIREAAEENAKNHFGFNFRLAVENFIAGANFAAGRRQDKQIAEDAIDFMGERLFNIDEETPFFENKEWKKLKAAYLSRFDSGQSESTAEQPVRDKSDRTFWYQEVMKQRGIVAEAHKKIFALEDEIRVLKFDYEQRIKESQSESKDAEEKINEPEIPAGDEPEPTKYEYGYIVKGMQIHIDELEVENEDMKAQLREAKMRHRNDDEYIKAIRDERDIYALKKEILTGISSAEYIKAQREHYTYVIDQKNKEIHELRKQLNDDAESLEIKNLREALLDRDEQIQNLHRVNTELQRRNDNQKQVILTINKREAQAIKKMKEAIEELNSISVYYKS